MNMEIYNAFAEWLDNLLKQDMPENTMAFNFNIYEEADEDDVELQEYGVQLIASDEFSNSDYDWACSEIYSSEEDIFYIDHSDEENADSQRGLEFICSLVEYYLNNGTYAQKLKDVKAVGVGFIDGDIEIVFQKAE